MTTATNFEQRLKKVELREFTLESLAQNVLILGGSLVRNEKHQIIKATFWDGSVLEIAA
jgi:hypothetical protein